MGKATRWFKSLLGMKKEKDKNLSSNLSDKKRWSFGKSVRDSVCVGHLPESNYNNPGADTEEEESETNTTTATTWVKSSYYNSESSENEQNKHAIAVAAATAAAADAAVAAAHAAVAVVRLTSSSHGRGTLFNGANQKWAAIRIQTVFRGYLAKKALRALKGLVKLQALVRGYLVRKQADATLHSMQALIRAQLSIRSQKARYQLNQEQRSYPEFRPRRSTERYDDTRSEHTASIHSRRLSASLEAAINTFEETPKIVEIDTCRPKSRSRRTPNHSISDYGEDPGNHPARTESPRLQACPVPARMSIPDCRNFHEFDWALAADECRFSTAQSTPRFVNSCNAPVTPAKSVCTERLFRPYSNFPNYMANTQSFKAKVRSYSAPKQRPDTAGSRKKLSLSEIAESRASLSGVRMQRSCSQAQEAISFKNAVMGKFDRPSEFVCDTEREYFQRRW